MLCVLIKVITVFGTSVDRRISINVNGSCNKVTGIKRIFPMVLKMSSFTHPHIVLNWYEEIFNRIQQSVKLQNPHVVPKLNDFLSSVERELILRLEGAIPLRNIKELPVSSCLGVKYGWILFSLYTEGLKDKHRNHLSPYDHNPAAVISNSPHFVSVRHREHPGQMK